MLLAVSETCDIYDIENFNMLSRELTHGTREESRAVAGKPHDAAVNID